MPNLEAAVGVLSEYGRRSTLHGLSHMFQSSGNMRRKVFWIVLTFGGCGACFYHIFATVSNFLDSPITSIYRDEGPEASFPGVTICSLKPVSEALMHTVDEKESLFHHLDEKWSFFDNWLVQPRYRRQNESRVHYKERQRGLFKVYTDVFWTSDDTRNFGMSDRHLVLSCIYKGRHCNSSNFKLIQHHRYWNCYTFDPPEKDRVIENTNQNSGLRLILFTDSNFDNQTLEDGVNYQRQMTEYNEMQHPYSLRTYLTEGGRTLNQVLTGNKWEADGLRIFIHNESQFPTTSDVAFDIASSFSIEVSVKQVNMMNRQPEHPCQEDGTETVQYVRYFGEDGAGRRTYRVNQIEAVMRAQQEMVYRMCGCYTHLLPFSCNISQLCLFAGPHERMYPSKNFLTRLACHMITFKLAEKSTSQLMQRFAEKEPCTSWKLQATKVQVPWPRSDEFIDFVNYILLPAFSSKEPRTDRVMHLMGTNRSRSDAILKHLFNPNCRKKTGLNMSLTDSWCISKRKMTNNVARIWIKPASTTAGVYREEYSYDWPEALSEVGGIFGLWMGISLLSVMEFLELLFILLAACFSRERKSEGGGGRSGGGAKNGIPPEIDAILRYLMTQQEDTPWSAAPYPMQMPQQTYPLIRTPSGADLVGRSPSSKLTAQRPVMVS